MTIDEMIAILQAYKEGKTIEFKHNGDEEWEDCPSPVWDFGLFQYRIKPEPHYRPFKSAEEVMKAIKEHGDWVKLDKGVTYQHIITFADALIRLGEKVSNYESVFEDYVFADGTPFGVKEE